MSLLAAASCRHCAETQLAHRPRSLGSLRRNTAPLPRFLSSTAPHRRGPGFVSLPKSAAARRAELQQQSLPGRFPPWQSGGRHPKTQEACDALDADALRDAQDKYERSMPKRLTFRKLKAKRGERLLTSLNGSAQEAARTKTLRGEAAPMKNNNNNSRLVVKDPVRPPSEASGGVPEPTAAYLAKAAEPSVRLAAARPLLVVIDLNGTLLFRPNTVRNPKEFVQRPHAAAFLRYCVTTFWAVAWSSARPDNVSAMCSKLVPPPVLKELVAVWGRDRFGLTPEDFAARVQCYKRLPLLWADPEVARSHPDYAAGGRWSQENTVLIDDSPEKARSEPHNALIVPSFTGEERDAYARMLPYVHDLLNELCFESNVSSYLREHPFRPTADMEAIAGPPVSGGRHAQKTVRNARKKAQRTHEPATKAPIVLP